LSIKKVESNRNFANKLWNATRLVIGSIPDVPTAPHKNPQWTLADGFIWARCEQLIRSVKRLFDSHQYGEAGRQVYEFFWSDYADWYLEIAKLQIAEGHDRAFYTVDLMIRVLEYVLRLLHPFTPFVTEELHGHLKAAANAHSANLVPEDGVWSDRLIIAPWPDVGDLQGWEQRRVKEFELFQDIVRAIRNARAEKNVKPSQNISASIVAGEFVPILDNQAVALASLAKIDPDQLKIYHALDNKPENSIVLVVGQIEIFLPLAGMVNTKEERARMEKALAEAENQITRLEKLLNSPFAEKAPPNVVQGERDRLSGFKNTAEKLREQLKLLA
jgi:valyl-tRNA synthetase